MNSFVFLFTLRRVFDSLLSSIFQLPSSASPASTASPPHGAWSNILKKKSKQGHKRHHVVCFRQLNTNILASSLKFSFTRFDYIPRIKLPLHQVCIKLKVSIIIWMLIIGVSALHRAQFLNKTVNFEGDLIF